MKKLWIVVISMMVFAACNSSVKKSGVENADSMESPLLHKVKVDEVIQTSEYTYLDVTEKNEKYWIAVLKDDIKIGEELFYFTAAVTPMENFHSTELNRDFERILFISQISKESGETMTIGNPQEQMGGHAEMMSGHGEMAAAHSGRKQADAASDIKVKKAEGGITIAELYENPKNYAGKKVKISGVVVKVNNQIMGRNWIHIQDGTKHGEDYDLTITTQEATNLNDVVVIEGTVSIDKDFTSGYFYPVIVEDANVLN